MAFGEVGISHSDFWNMTLQEILNAHTGYLDAQYHHWRRTRFLGACVYNAHRFKDDPKVKPTDLLKLPGDVDGERTEDEIERLKEYRKWRTGH